MTGIVFVMADSLRADHVGAYGADAVETPNLDRFAEGATVFERNYPGSYPTLPNRNDLWTGRYNFLYRGWTPFEDAPALPELLTEHGITATLVHDTPPLRGARFRRGFTSWTEIRGNLGDTVVTDPTVPTPLPAAPHKLKGLGRTEQYLRNRSAWDYERDYVGPRTFTAAMEWLETNRTHDEFFLLVDTWPPHEQFDPPAHYLERYADTDAEADDILYPMYGHADYMTEEDRERVRARYAGEVAMVDTWMGRLLETIDRLGLADDVLVAFTSDHGHLFGEHGLQGKPTGILGGLYETSTRTPLLVRHPEGHAAGERVDALTQHPDLMPTVLDFFDVPIPEGVHGESILPLLTGERDAIREYALTGRYPEGYGGGGIPAIEFDGWAGPARVSQPVTVTTERWALVCYPDPDDSELYDLAADPDQERDVIDEHPDVAAELRGACVAFMEERDAEAVMLEPFASDGAAYVRESLAPDETVYTIRADGHTFAYLTAARARPRQSPGDDEGAVTERFGDLAEREPEAFVELNEQYYYARELLVE